MLTKPNVRTILAGVDKPADRSTDRPTKGEQTRAAILDAALHIVSKVGLEGLTIGTLADATGMSKSGLFAHFGSREDLQLAVLEHAAQGYGKRWSTRRCKIERGLPRLQALFARWLDWTDRPDLPGGCIMISAAPRVRRPAGRDARRGHRQPARGRHAAARHGAPRDRGGPARPDTDPEQIAFEMLGIVLASHHHRRLLGDKEARKRALTAFDALIARHAAPARRSLRAPLPARP